MRLDSSVKLESFIAAPLPEMETHCRASRVSANRREKLEKSIAGHGNSFGLLVAHPQGYASMTGGCAKWRASREKISVSSEIFAVLFRRDHVLRDNRRFRSRLLG